MVPKPAGRRMAPRWLQAVLAIACAGALGVLAVASLGSWSDLESDEARCVRLLDQLLGDKGTLTAEARLPLQTAFDRCKEQGTITADDVEDYIDRHGLSDEDA